VTASRLADHLARVKVPTTVVYGSRDSIVPPEQSRAVAAMAAGETRVVEIAGADHNTPPFSTGSS
jgi:pimeloyl-ACP methyl ester carboxylesterase